MKKTIAIITSIFFLASATAKAEVGAGITGALHMFDGSGTETTRNSLEKNTGSHSHNVLVPELFVEAISDNGVVLGLSYIPTREMGSKSRTDTNSDGDTGTYTAKAELANVGQIYVDVPLPIDLGYPIYAKLGAQHVTVKTLESLNSGTTYPDKDLLGLTIGLGTRGDLPYGDSLYYKFEVTYTDFETYSETGGSTGNQLEADFDDTAAKFSVGYKF